LLPDRYSSRCARGLTMPPFNELDKPRPIGAGCAGAGDSAVARHAVVVVLRRLCFDTRSYWTGIIRVEVFSRIRPGLLVGASAGLVICADHFAPPDSKSRRSDTFHARRPCIETGRIGPHSQQAHLRRVCGARLIACAASSVGRVSRPLATAASSGKFSETIISSMWRNAPRRDCLCRRVDGFFYKYRSILPRKYPLSPNLGE